MPQTQPSEADKKLYVEIWSKAIDTQMHFNEMSVKSRQLGLTFVAAALGTGVVLLSRGADFTIDFEILEAQFRLHVSVLLIFGAALALISVAILDLVVYHKMLRGSVAFGEDFEENYMKQIFDLEKGMTQSISHLSRISDARTEMCDGRMKYKGCKKSSAYKKIRNFYAIAVITLILLGGFVFLATDYKTMRTGMADHVNGVEEFEK